MKLRICDNSIRLRLSQTEVAQLSEGKPVEGQSDLAPAPLCYRLEISTDRATPNVAFSAGTLTVDVPWEDVRRWAKTDQVGIKAACPGTAGSASVQLLIEKDFQCLHGPTGESQEDRFPNPRTP